MARKEIVKPSTPGRRPNLPQHNLPEPFATLQFAGYEEQVELYQKIRDTAKPNEVAAIIDGLAAMALDESYYSYSEEDIDGESEEDIDLRCFAPIQAVRALCYFGEAAASAIPRLIPLFATDDMVLREELPLLFTCIGLDSVLPLMQVMIDGKEDIYLRDGAAESLVEMTNEYPELSEEVEAALGLAMAHCEDRELTGYFITGLMDLGATDALPLIESAFENDKVDPDVVTLDQVREHFAALTADTTEGVERLRLANLPLTEDDEQERIPYVAMEKIGRNDQCPCGSGKKYKKCCGANA